MLERIHSRGRYIEGQGEPEECREVEFEREYGEEDEEVRRQEQIEEEKEFDRGLPGRYTAKLIHGWGNRKYKRERERERRWDENWNKWKHSLG